ncbi:MAG: 4-phosphoerythronate dehydrogenase [Halomonadaceae bacterium]|nr:MAG: 4-phosphoerythronate dehydrogenase [Halomonadaceae bacterium]
MHIVADENIPFLEAFFAGLPGITRLERLPGRQLQRSQLTGCDALLVRSVTPVNQALLAETPIRFVGTATIGTDHVDHDWLHQQGIAFASAPGCNAEGVVDYVLSTLVRHCQQQQVSLWQRSVGIVGAGNVGGRLWRRLQALGVRVHACDPPRQMAGERGLESLEAILQQDLICLHTPLTTSGPHATLHLLDGPRLAALKGHQLLLNAGRGPVVDNGALVSRLQQPDAPRVCLDVWEGEPQVMLGLLPLVWQGSPHIAGYSLEGKARGTAMLYQAFCRHLGLTPQVKLAEVLPPPLQMSVTGGGEAPLTQAILAAYDPRGDQERFMASQQGSQELRAQGFDQLRKTYPVRREYASHRVAGIKDLATARLFTAAGFTVAED